MSRRWREPITPPRCQTGKGLARVGCEACFEVPPFPASKRKAASFTRFSVLVPALVASCASCASCSGVKCTSMLPDYEITGSGAMLLKGTRPIKAYGPMRGLRCLATGKKRNIETVSFETIGPESRSCHSRRVAGLLLLPIAPTNFLRSPFMMRSPNIPNGWSVVR